MDGRGHIPTYEGVQASGMLRHGPFPVVGPSGHRLLEPRPPADLLENRMAVQAADIEALIRENRRLAASHIALREELVAVQQETQKQQAHMGSIQTESDIQLRGLLEKIAKMEADIQAGENLKKDLQQAHVEAQALVTDRLELNDQLKQTSMELEKVLSDMKKLPEMKEELDSLRQNHQKLRVAFEHEKGLNINQVERMHAMERNLISLAREVEKLRAEVLNAEKRARAAPNAYDSAYVTPDPQYPPIGLGGGFAHPYERPQMVEGSNPYTGKSVVGSGISTPASGGNNEARGGTYDARGISSLRN